MSEEKKLFCPGCKEWYPVTHFNGLPLDLRCNKCLPAETAMGLYDEKVKLAGQQLTLLVDASEDGKSLRALDRMLEGYYDAFGGRNTLMEFAAEWTKDLAQTGKKNQALSFIAKVLSIHSKVEKTKVEEDWNRMSKAEIKAKLTLLLADILARTELPVAKQNALQKLIGGQE